MGKFQTLVPKNLFKKNGGELKSKISDEERSSAVNHSTGSSERDSETLKNQHVAKEIPNNLNLSPHSKEITTILANLTSESLEEKLYNLERTFLFEQNNTIETFEREKHELIDSFNDEKLRVKRAYEHEKMELLKEIERKDKMLVELSKILKSEYEKNLADQKDEVLEMFENKIKMFKETQVKITNKLSGLKKIVENNENSVITVERLDELKLHFDEYMILAQTVSELHRSNMIGSEKSLSPLQQKVKTEKQKVGDREDETTVVQQELAEAYRKQKTELMKLFNSEKEEYMKNIEKEKRLFEKSVRIEYESRMQIERKAWQETIEDYEREIAILKFEREQMDRNYCISMDELKTEFEREKRSLHRSYSANQADLKKALGGYSVDLKQLPTKHQR